MTFTLRPSKVFLEQVRELSEKERHLIADKLLLVQSNPFRYKSLSVPGLTKVFEIKLTLNQLYSRIVYKLDGDEIRIECILNRKHDFKDLHRLLEKARRNKVT